MDSNNNENLFTEDINEPSAFSDAELKKKSFPKKILLIFAVLVIILAFILLFATPSTKKDNKTKVLTEEVFKNISKTYNYTVSDLSQEGIENTKKVLIAEDTEDCYQIEYFVFKDSDSAELYFYECTIEFKEIASDELDTEPVPDTKETADYQMHSIVTPESFFRVIRKDDSIIYVNIPVQYQDEASKFLKDIGC